MQDALEDKQRIQTGLKSLDRALGGGYLPGSMVMLVGATGVGKTQFGTHFSNQGLKQEGNLGTVVDLSSRGDSQNHSGYMQRMFGRQLTTADPADDSLHDPFTGERPRDVLPFLGYGGRRVLRSQMDADGWHAWQSELNRRMPRLFRFVYSHLISGTRRFIIDGIEPQDSAADSLQLDLMELIYHRMLRQEHDWLAREVLRERFRENEQLVSQHAYAHDDSVALVLVTTKHAMLEQLMQVPLADGDLAAAANTVIYLGRQLVDGQMQRALYIAKHRGSFADQRVVQFDIDHSGIVIAHET